MLKFHELPPTAASTEVDPKAIRRLAYSVEDRCINNVAEACATLVFANSDNITDIMEIGFKAAEAIRTEPKRERSAREDDAGSFLIRYNDMVDWLVAIQAGPSDTAVG